MDVGDRIVILHATVDINGYPSQTLVTLGEDLAWWAVDSGVAKYLQALSPVLGITPSQPSRVVEMYKAVRKLEPTLKLVKVEDENVSTAVPGRIY